MYCNVLKCKSTSGPHHHVTPRICSSRKLCHSVMLPLQQSGDVQGKPSTTILQPLFARKIVMSLQWKWIWQMYPMSKTLWSQKSHLLFALSTRISPQLAKVFFLNEWNNFSKIGPEKIAFLSCFFMPKRCVVSFSWICCAQKSGPPGGWRWFFENRQVWNL